jgi:beta-glucanase (GH16 family)
MAGGVATWPAMWLLGADCQQTNITSANNFGTCNWPAPGSDEIDMTEILIQGGPVNQAIHSGPGNNNSTINPGCTGFPPTGDPESEFHDYEVDWQPGTVTWKIDGVQTCKVNNSAVPSQPMFLIINTAIFPSAKASSPWPQYTEVDYVKITQ